MVDLDEYTKNRNVRKIYCRECLDGGSLWRIKIKRTPSGWKHQESALPCKCKKGAFMWGEEGANAYGVSRETLVLNSMECLILRHIIEHGQDPDRATMDYALSMGSDIVELRSIARQLRGGKDED